MHRPTLGRGGHENMLVFLVGLVVAVNLFTTNKWVKWTKFRLCGAPEENLDVAEAHQIFGVGSFWGG